MQAATRYERLLELAWTMDNEAKFRQLSEVIRISQQEVRRSELVDEKSSLKYIRIIEETPALIPTNNFQMFGLEFAMN